MRYIDLFWESDNTDPYDDLFMFEGFSNVYAQLTRLRLVTDPIDINHRTTSLTYAYHDAMMGMLGIGADILSWSDEKTDEVRGLVARYKEVRETVQFGHVYRLSSPRAGEITSTQFVHRDGGESVVFAYLHSSRFGLYRSMLRLQGLDPQAMYRVNDEETPVSGQALMKRGLHLDLKGDFVSRMIVIRRA
jgi:alpha-galactosidase